LIRIAHARDADMAVDGRPVRWPAALKGRAGSLGLGQAQGATTVSPGAGTGAHGGRGFDPRAWRRSLAA